MKTILALAILLIGSVFAFGQDEQAPLVEKNLKYKDFTYKNIRTNEDVNLRDFAGGKKLVMVVYYAPWCPNWRHEAPFAQKLYDKYKDKGFDVIGVSEYDTIEAAKTDLDKKNITFTVVAESDSKDAKKKTPHYEYRIKTGDTRNWGSPWNIFIEAENLREKGDVLVKKAFVVNGELIEDEVEKYVRRELGLPAEDAEAKAKNKEIEVCEEGNAGAEFKKP